MSDYEYDSIRFNMEKQDQNKGSFVRVLFSAVGIGLVSVVLGLGFNAANPRGIPLDYTKIAKTDTEKIEKVDCEPIPIYAEEVYELLESENVIFVDSRQPHEFAEGHIARAINIPVDEAYPEYQKYKSKFNPDSKIIFYCDEGCDSAMEVAFFFCNQGFKDGNILVFEDGFVMWKDLGYPVEL